MDAQTPTQTLTSIPVMTPMRAPSQTNHITGPNPLLPPLLLLSDLTLGRKSDLTTRRSCNPNPNLTLTLTLTLVLTLTLSPVHSSPSPLLVNISP